MVAGWLVLMTCESGEAWLRSGFSQCLVGRMSFIHSANIRWTLTVCHTVELDF